MKQPCNNCPFRKSVKFPLSTNRRLEISKTLKNDGDFPCHKTIDYYKSDDGRSTENSKRCIGAAIYQEKAFSNNGGCRANIIFRLALRSGEFSMKDLESDSDIWNSEQSFVTYKY